MRVYRAAAVLGAISLLCAGGGMAQSQSDLGRSLYLSRCASCHGTSGKGDGPLSRTGQLTKPPTDLTTLKKSNAGVFPAQRVYDVIDGRADVAAHGPRDMPVWGEEFRARVPGLPRADGVPLYDFPSTVAQAKIIALVDYLDRIQAP